MQLTMYILNGKQNHQIIFNVKAMSWSKTTDISIDSKMVVIYPFKVFD